MEFLATAPLLAEKVVEKELLELGAEKTFVKRGKVFFESDLSKACEIGFNLRTGKRILMPLLEFKYSSKELFYEAAREFEWENYIDVKETFSVRLKGGDSLFKNSAFVSLLLKDAIVDRIRDKKGVRPSVSKENPQVEVLGFIQNNTAEISLDLCGALHKRGYRKYVSKGALNESLAAVILKISEYCGKTPFIDPMAGSGTIGIEAALIASNIAPGLFWKKGRSFFSRNLITEKDKQKIVARAKEKIVVPKEKIVLSDINPDNIKISMQNASNAGISDYVTFLISDFFELNLNIDSGIIVTNTPYGDHTEIGEEESLFFKKIGDKLKKDYCNFTAYLLLGNSKAVKSIGLNASKKILLYNGKKEVKLCVYEIYKGSKKTVEQE